ncbi:MAG: S8 family serine peptidase [Ignavibacteriaceae bacterium]
MKKTLLLLISLLLLGTEVYSQVMVSTRLQTALANSEADEYVRGLILLRDQVDILGLDAQLYEEKATLQDRAFRVITALQEKAASTQGNLIAFIEANLASKKIFSYQTFWIANMIMIEAKPEIFQQLSNSMEISQLDLDAVLQYDRPTISSEGNLGTETTELGLRVINAHLLWQMGVTGLGRIAMNIDTGVYPTHPALQHKWRGTHVPINQAWFDPAVPNPTATSDCDGHGSHTMGTMVGRSLTTADTVGVAFDAEWIAAKTICSSPHTSNSVAAFQWAMNPDGNPLTITDMPDAISCSWYDPDVTNECTGIYVTTLNSVEAAGIGVVFSAGNNGPGASTVTKPKNISTNEVNVFSVAAIDGALYNGGNLNPIASFSSRGPSTCGGTGSLLIKPEVSAPGVNVRSSGSATGYTFLDGTSMASPHVAGAIVLLKSAFPTLTGHQIKMALYNSAKDLGAVGEDNNYGKGLIDVYAAFLSLGTPDVIPPTPITNLSVTNATSNGLTLNWTAPSDTSVGGVTRYDVRMSTSPITDTLTFAAATPVTYTGAPDTAGTPQQLFVPGLTPNTPYYFNVRSRDTWGNWSNLSNPGSGTTLQAPLALITPVSITKTLASGGEVTDTIKIKNNSGFPSTLDYSVVFNNNTFPEGKYTVQIIPAKNESEAVNDNKDNPVVTYGQSIEGSGGPDLGGYEWIDSDEPNGPAYVWNDITSTGTAVTNWIATGTFGATDEGYSGPYNFGFNFKFYGQVKTQFYLGSNGFICFAPVTANAFTNAAIPTAAVPNELIVPFWDDLDAKSPGTVHYKLDGNKMIIQWTNYQRYSGTASYTWQAHLYSSGKIIIYYKEMTGTINSATVGLENADGTIGLQVAYNSTYIKNNLALKFSAEPDWLVTTSSLNGTVYNGNTANMVLSFKTEDYPLGLYTMDVVVTSNATNTPSVTVPVAMTIVPIPVEMTSFTAEASNGFVSLKWETATETNNQGFRIERRRSGTESWSDAGFVEGHGSTAQAQSYTFVDKNSSVGKFEYRLKQVDFNGTFEYSKVVEVEVGLPTAYVLDQNYPNPFNPNTTINYSIPEKADINISIYSAIGEFITTLVGETKEAGYYTVEFDASKLASGTYIYQLTASGSNGKTVQSKKMILMK